MKKNVKKLSAILAILLLCMTLTVPATAVEYDIEPRRLYVIDSRNEVYIDPLTDEELLYCSAYLYYNSNNKVAYMSADSSLAGYDFREFGVEIDGYVNCSSGYNDRTPRGEAYGRDIYDIAEVDLTADVSSDCISIGSGNSFFVDTFSAPVVDWAFFGVEGDDFDY